MNLSWRQKLCASVLLCAWLTGCATVKPYEKEHLADSLMNDPYEAAADMHEMKWLDTREGSTGGAGGAGGGCACR